MLKQSEDAYGQEVYDYFQGLPAYEIIERDDGLIALSVGPLAYFAEFADWRESEREAAGLAKGRVLDVGCGPGRACLHFQAQGMEAVGIDISPLAVKTAQLRGVRDARVLPISQVSRKQLGVFDTIVMFGNNFGLFGNPRRAKWLLRRFHGMASPTAVILAVSRDVQQTEDPDHLAYHERNRRKARPAGQVRIRVRYKRIKGSWFDYLMVSETEMAEIVAGTGWRIAHTIHEAANPGYVAVLAKE